MEVFGFIGASGTGKSHHALVVAYDHDIQAIIDDGLLIGLHLVAVLVLLKQNAGTADLELKALAAHGLHQNG